MHESMSHYMTPCVAYVKFKNALRLHCLTQLEISVSICSSQRAVKSWFRAHRTCFGWIVKIERSADEGRLRQARSGARFWVAVWHNLIITSWYIGLVLHRKLPHGRRDFPKKTNGENKQTIKLAHGQGSISASEFNSMTFQVEFHGSTSFYHFVVYKVSKKKLPLPGKWNFQFIPTRCCTSLAKDSPSNNSEMRFVDNVMSLRHYKRGDQLTRKRHTEFEKTTFSRENLKQTKFCPLK